MTKICPFITKLPIPVPTAMKLESEEVWIPCIEDKCMAWVPAKQKYKCSDYSAYLLTAENNPYKPGYCKLIGEITE